MKHVIFLLIVLAIFLPPFAGIASNIFQGKTQMSSGGIVLSCKWSEEIYEKFEKVENDKILYFNKSKKFPITIRFRNPLCHNILNKDHGLNHGKLKQTEDKYVCSFDFSGVDDTTTVVKRYEVITVNRYSGDATRKYNEKRYVHKNKETVYQIELMDRYKCNRVKERKF